jgi:phosphoribosylformylglycinamidine synthase
LGDADPYQMAAASIDEAIRNVVSVGGDPHHTAILDNFCWGNIHRPETFGQLVRAAEGCRDTAIAFGTPFISGKDSLNNEFAFQGDRIIIPPTLLISALAIVPDVRQATTMDAKQAGNVLLVVGLTKNEMSGSHFNMVTQSTGGDIPSVDAPTAAQLYSRIHQAMMLGLVRSCHDVSEGGLAVALAEMSFAGHLGLVADLSQAPRTADADPIAVFFGESCSRMILEVSPSHLEQLRSILADSPHSVVGHVVSEPRLKLTFGEKVLVDAACDELLQRWRTGFTV